MRLPKEQFIQRLKSTMDKCNSSATDRPPADEDQIELHFMGKNDVDFDTAISRLFIDEETSYVFIDVAVHPKRNGWFFMVVSGHEPAPIEKVYDYDGLGPFKALVPA